MSFHKLRQWLVSCLVLLIGLSAFIVTLPATSHVNAAPNSSVKKSGTNTFDEDACNLSANPVTWIICPVMEIAAEAIEVVDHMVTDSLEFDSENFFEKQGGYKMAWNTFRYISVGLLVVVGLVVVIAQSLGLEILDAYTIRKTLPRLIIATICITFSWPLMHFLVDLSNVASVSLRNLIYLPFDDLQASPETGTGLVTALIGYITWTNYGLFGGMSLLLTGALALLFGFAIIAIRNIGVQLLIILAPLAFLTYILPNTQKVWKLWTTNLTALLLMFPVVSLMIAVGRVFSAVATQPVTSGNVVENAAATTLNQLLGFVAYFAPYFLLGFAFKMAGGFIANISGMVNDRNRGVFDRLSKGRQRNASRRWDTRWGRPMLQRQADFHRRMTERASRSGRIGKLVYGTAADTIGGYNVEANISARQAAVNKELNDQIATGRDESIRGLSVNKRTALAGWELSRQNNNFITETAADGSHTVMSHDQLYRERYDSQGNLRGRDFKTLGGAWVAEKYVDEGYRRWGNDAFAQQAALSFEMRKAMTSEQVQGISDRYVDLARDGWGMNRTQADGAWIGSGFENQNLHVEYKNTRIADWGRRNVAGSGHMALNAETFSTEVYEKKGSYPLSQMSSHTIEQLINAYHRAGATGDTATQQRIQGIAETFMQRGGGTTTLSPTGTGADDAPRPSQQGVPTGSGYYQTGAQGAASVNEAVRRLAVETGVYQTLTPGPESPPPEPITLPRQK